MNTNKKTARIVGALFITALVTYGLGSGLLESIQNAPDYLVNVSANINQMMIAVLLMLINSAVVVGIGVMLFPILKKDNETIARGYVGFRVIEAVMLIVALIGPLLLLTLSQEYIQAGAPDASYFQTLSTLSIKEYDLAYQMALIALGLAGLMFCYLLYQSKLIPRFISVLGLIGYALMLIGAFLELFGFNLGLIFSIPGGLFEIILAIWLIVKGFNSSAIASESTKTDIN